MNCAHTRPAAVLATLVVAVLALAAASSDVSADGTEEITIASGETLDISGTYESSYFHIESGGALNIVGSATFVSDGAVITAEEGGSVLVDGTTVSAEGFFELTLNGTLTVSADGGSLDVSIEGDAALETSASTIGLATAEGETLDISVKMSDDAVVVDVSGSLSSYASEIVYGDYVLSGSAEDVSIDLRAAFTIGSGIGLTVTGTDSGDARMSAGTYLSTIGAAASDGGTGDAETLGSVRMDGMDLALNLDMSMDSEFAISGNGSLNLSAGALGISAGGLDVSAGGLSVSIGSVDASASGFEASADIGVSYGDEGLTVTIDSASSIGEIAASADGTGLTVGGASTSATVTATLGADGISAGYAGDVSFGGMTIAVGGETDTVIDPFDVDVQATVGTGIAASISISSMGGTDMIDGEQGSFSVKDVSVSLTGDASSLEASLSVGSLSIDSPSTGVSAAGVSMTVDGVACDEFSVTARTVGKTVTTVYTDYSLSAAGTFYTMTETVELGLGDISEIVIAAAYEPDTVLGSDGTNTSGSIAITMADGSVGTVTVSNGTAGISDDYETVYIYDGDAVVTNLRDLSVVDYSADGSLTIDGGEYVSIISMSSDVNGEFTLTPMVKEYAQVRVEGGSDFDLEDNYVYLDVTIENGVLQTGTLRPYGSAVIEEGGCYTLNADGTATVTSWSNFRVNVTAPVYTLTYDGATMQASAGNPVELDDPEAREGYSFIGWYIVGEGSGTRSSWDGFMPAHDTELVSLWALEELPAYEVVDGTAVLDASDADGFVLTADEAGTLASSCDTVAFLIDGLRIEIPSGSVSSLRTIVAYDNTVGGTSCVSVLLRGAAGADLYEVATAASGNGASLGLTDGAGRSVSIGTDAYALGTSAYLSFFEEEASDDGLLNLCASIVVVAIVLIAVGAIIVSRRRSA